ncbi:MAG: HflC protein [Gammaproteobacteria bacterium]|nr:MAG: HflC protein [Gammaproteobacteria bacterium]
MSSLYKIFFAFIAAFIVFSSTVFYVDQRERVILLHLGSIQQASFEPGIHFKWPIADEVIRFDGRILTIDAQPENYLTGTNKNLLVDSFLLWKISDAAKYYTAVSGDQRLASSRLFHIVNNGLRDAFATRTVNEVVSGDRKTMVEAILITTNESAKELGIEVVNIRIKRIDFPKDINDAVYLRMQSERLQEANETRAQGAEEAEGIRATADKFRIITLAEAEQKAEEVRGQGDAKSTDIYAQAYGKDTDFYGFYRRLLAYKNVFNGDDMLVIEPKGEFFNNFGSQD